MANVAWPCCGSPRWQPRTKHWTSSKKLWDRSEIVRQTGQPGQPARYSPYVSRKEIEQFETRSEELTALPQTRSNVYAFYGQFDVEVGASNGERTRFVYIECTVDGSIHGRPITWDELVNYKGASP